MDHGQPVKGVQLIVLSEHVDYGNTLGWADPYSAHEFSERPQRYDNALHVPDVYTPQAVIDGRIQLLAITPPKWVPLFRKHSCMKKHHCIWSSTF